MSDTKNFLTVVGAGAWPDVEGFIPEWTGVGLRCVGWSNLHFMPKAHFPAIHCSESKVEGTR